MDMFSVNWLGVLVAAAVSMAVGFAWYSPMLFGKQWMKLSGLTEKKLEAAKKDMGRMYGLAMIGSIVMAIVLDMLLSALGITDLLGGSKVGFWVWLGFVAPPMFNSVLYENKSVNLYLINAGYQLVSLKLMGALLTLL